MTKIRPYLHEFLKNMSKFFEIGIFTSSGQYYAEAVVKGIDPNLNFISFVLDRRHCYYTEFGYAIKDLRIIKNRDLKNLIIIDNLVHSFGLQIDSGIPILEWKGDQNDCELKFIEKYLIEASKCDDIQIFNRKRLRLQELSKLRFEN